LAGEEPEDVWNTFWGFVFSIFFWQARIFGLAEWKDLLKLEKWSVLQILSCWASTCAWTENNTELSPFPSCRV